jgi:tubulin polyglutamylase TTLL11
VRKAVITLEPYLLHNYYQQISHRHEEAKNFHIVGFDILLDTKLRAWLMEINANPSFNMFLEKETPDCMASGGVTVEKTLSELDKYLKSKVASEAIHIVTGGDYNGVGPINRTEEDEKLFT